MYSYEEGKQAVEGYYKHSIWKEASRFPIILEKYNGAVEYSAASPLSNGFVKATNDKMKIVKRTMHGRHNAN